MTSAIPHRDLVYLDHNATTPLLPEALAAMQPYLKSAFGNPSSYHRLGRQAKIAVEHARKKLAGMLGALPHEIIFTCSGTEADNLALRGVAHALQDKGRHIVTSSIEHHAVLKTCTSLERDGRQVTYLPVDAHGIVDPEDVRRHIRPDTILITVMYANNETGVIQPIPEIGAIARSFGVLFHTDAVQAFGKVPLDIRAIPVDLLSVSSHKIYGPKGAGALFVKDGVRLAPLMTGGNHEHNMRAGTENVPAIVGFAAAAAQIVASLPAESKRMASLRDYFEKRIQESIPGVKINGKNAPRVPNTSSISFPSIESESILLHLDLLGICASAGSACTTGSTEPSHVLQAMGLPAEDAQGTVRFSLGHEISQKELDFTVNALNDISNRLRLISSVAAAS